MLSPALAQALKQAQRIHRLIWFAMLFTVLIYCGVVYALDHFGSLQDLAADVASTQFIGMLESLAVPCCAVFALLSLLVGRLTLSPARVEKALTTETTAEKLATSPQGQVSQSKFQLLNHLEPTELSYYNLSTPYLVTMMIRLALAEAIVIIGLILTMMKGEPRIILPFALVALVLTISAFPRLLSFVERTDRHRLSMGGLT